MEFDYNKRNRKKSLAIQYQYLNERYLTLLRSGSKSSEVIEIKKQMDKIKELYDKAR